MKLLVLGSGSQLGKELAQLLKVKGVDHNVVDTREINLPKKQEIIRLIGRHKPDQVINVTSFSNLTKVEEDEKAASLCDVINSEGVSTLAGVCASLDIPLLHHSSSFVFDGQKLRPYDEEDQTAPIGRYGLSKWYGERAIRDTLNHHVIIRTDWLFSVYRDRFFRLHIEACKRDRGCTEVMNHRFSPTPAADAARVFLAVAQQVDCRPDVWGTYHYCALQPMSEEHFVENFLREAMRYDPELARLEDRLEIRVRDVRHPYTPNTTLSAQKIMETFGIKQRPRTGEVTRVLKSLYGIADDDSYVEPSVIRDEIPEPDNPQPAGSIRAKSRKKAVHGKDAAPRPKSRAGSAGKTPSSGKKRA